MFETDHNLQTTLQSFSSALTAKRRMAWIAASFVVIATILVTLISFTQFDQANPRIKILPPLFGVIGLIGVNQRLIRTQQRMVIPHLAKTVDLSYQQESSSFVDNLPARLLPRSDRKFAKDRLSGMFGGRHIQMAEVTAQNYRRTTQTLFQGIVLSMPNATPMPAFYLALRQTKAGRLCEVNHKGLTEVRTMKAKSGAVFGLWLSKRGLALQDPSLKAVVDRLINIDAQIGQDVQLFSITSNGEEMHIALSSKRDLYRIGGLIAGKQRTEKSIGAALSNLHVPLSIMSTLLEAEQLVDANKQTSI